MFCDIPEHPAQHQSIGRYFRHQLIVHIVLNEIAFRHFTDYGAIQIPFFNTASTAASLPFSTTISIRSCDSDSNISKGCMFF